MSKLGYSCGRIDGKEGPNTKKGVKSYQNAKGLAVDGIAGRKTRAKIDEDYTRAQEKKKEAREEKEYKRKYIFTAKSFRCKEIRSGSITLKLPLLNIYLKDENGNPIPGELYEITMPNGKIIKGKLDEKGRAKVRVIDENKCIVRLPDRPDATWEK